MAKNNVNVGFSGGMLVLALILGGCPPAIDCVKTEHVDRCAVFLTGCAKPDHYRGID